MRQLSESQVQQYGQGGRTPQEPPAPPGEATPMYPTPPIGRFTVVPPEDATAADNHIDIITQTDEELADAERKEGLRERGIVVEDDEELHPGVEVDS